MLTFNPFIAPWPGITLHFFDEEQDTVSEENSEPQQPAVVRPLFTKVTREPHKFGGWESHKRIFRADGIDQIERRCLNCPLVRITVMQGEGRREYRFADDGEMVQFEAEREPSCVGRGQEGLSTMEAKP